VGSAAGLSDEKILALGDYATSPLYDEVERVALAYADAITFTDRDVDDALFAALRQHYSDDAIVELTGDHRLGKLVQQIQSRATGAIAGAMAARGSRRLKPPATPRAVSHLSNRARNQAIDQPRNLRKVGEIARVPEIILPDHALALDREESWQQQRVTYRARQCYLIGGIGGR
jgi:hypothetical protein